MLPTDSVWDASDSLFAWGKDFRYFSYMTDCQGPLSRVSWLRVPEQAKLEGGVGPSPTILNSEIHCVLSP